MSEWPEWQPIDTAPTDGEWFLVSVKEATVPVLVHAIGPGSAVLEGFWCDFTETATHWMPLPEPPK